MLANVNHSSAAVAVAVDAAAVVVDKVAVASLHGTPYVDRVESDG